MSTIGTIVIAIILAAIVIAIVVYLMNWLYRRSSKEVAFVRTGLGGQKVVMNGGAFVLPIIHEVIPVNMNTLRLEVQRGRERALITKNRMRVDVVAEFYLRVQSTAEAIANAAQTLMRGTQSCRVSAVPAPIVPPVVSPIWQTMMSAPASVIAMASPSQKT